MLLMSGGTSAGGVPSAAASGSAAAILGCCRVSPKRIAASMPASAAPAMSHGTRSRDGALADKPTAWPQAEQNRARGESAAPQARHGAPARGVPQLEQNASAPAVPQEGQGVGAAVVMVAP